MAEQQTYHIQGMDCADCALKIEKGVRQLQGAQAVQVNFSTGLLQIEGDPQPDDVKKRVEALGYQIAEKRPTRAKEQGSALASFWRYLLGRSETRLALIGGVLLIVSLPIYLLGAPSWLVQGLQILALAIAGYPIVRSGLSNLWINRDFNINLLMTIAGIGAVVIGETAEAATLIFLFAIAEALEGFTADRARRVLDELNDLAPAQAVRISAGKEETMPVEMLRLGDRILIKAGERIPMDGKIETGQSAVNQAPITGESVPVEKEPGDEVFAGTVNGSGALIVEVTRLVQDTTIQRIIRMIEQAQSVRAPTQRFIDRFAQVYTPLMVVIAALVAVVPPLLFGQPFFNLPGETGWLYRALALLVIACPCALVISAPVTVISAITAAARRGVLIKGGAFLEALAGINAFAFDKTGTLTHGQPVVTNFHATDCNGDQTCQPCEDVLALASSLERRSAHPLARSVVAAAEQRGVIDRYQPAQDVVALAGSGVQGRVNGKLATVGSHKLFDREHPHLGDLCDKVKDAESAGHTTMLVCDGDRVVGFIAAADTLREGSRGVIEELKTLGKTTVMLTGDNATVAKSIGDSLALDEVLANLLPEDKVSAVQRLREEHGRVAMIGDGINDSPALAAADLGIAMGGAGSAQAMETADIVLIGGDLHPLPFAVRLSAFARSLIRQNVIISLGTKLVFVGLTMAGYTSLWLAVMADMGVSLLVTANALRANRFERGR